MNQTHDEKIKRLKAFVDAGLESFDKKGDLNPEYVDDILSPILNEMLKDTLHRIEERHKFENDQHSYVVHYTSIDTLVSLLENEIAYSTGCLNDKLNTSLRLYDSVHFNDPDEGNYIVHRLKSDGKYNWIYKDDIPYTHESASYAYIASFIMMNDEQTMHDELVFWRTYGREGQGCSLVLPIHNNLLRKVLYEDDEVNSTVRILLEVLTPILDLLHPLAKTSDHIGKLLARIIWNSLAGIRFLYKDKAYKYEREARIIIHRSEIKENDICFEYDRKDNSSKYIRHYYQHQSLQISELLTSGSYITLGPSVPYRYDVEYCIKSLLEKAMLRRKTQVRLSEINYRKP